MERRFCAATSRGLLFAGSAGIGPLNQCVLRPAWGVSRGDVMGRACRPGEGWRPTTRFSPADVAGHSCHVACGSHARGATLRKMCRDSCPEALAPPNVRRVSRAAVPGSAADLLRFARRPAWCLAQICRVAGAEVVSLSRGPAWFSAQACLVLAHSCRVSAHTCLVSRPYVVGLGAYVPGLSSIRGGSVAPTRWVCRAHAVGLSRTRDGSVAHTRLV